MHGDLPWLCLSYQPDCMLAEGSRGFSQTRDRTSWLTLVGGMGWNVSLSFFPILDFSNDPIFTYKTGFNLHGQHNLMVKHFYCPNWFLFLLRSYRGGTWEWGWPVVKMWSNNLASRHSQYIWMLPVCKYEGRRPHHMQGCQVDKG